MKKLAWLAFVIPLLLAACGGSSSGSTTSSTDVAIWDQSQWDSSTNWQP